MCDFIASHPVLNIYFDICNYIVLCTFVVFCISCSWLQYYLNVLKIEVLKKMDELA